MFARYGGEEFALLLPGADAATAQAVAARVHAEVAREPLPHPNSPVGDMVKEAGRNRTCVYGQTS